MAGEAMTVDSLHGPCSCPVDRRPGGLLHCRPCLREALFLLHPDHHTRMRVMVVPFPLTRSIPTHRPVLTMNNTVPHALCFAVPFEGAVI
jgi:hypothetical protein